MKNTALLIIIILFSMLTSGYTKHVVIKYDDFNELYRGTVISDKSGQTVLNIKSDTSGIACTGNSAVYGRTFFNYINPIYNGIEGKAYLKCNDKSTIYSNWKVKSFTLNKTTGTAEDVYDRKMSFYIDNNEKNVTKKLVRYQKEVSGKPLLKEYKPEISIDPSKFNKNRENLTPFASNDNKSINGAGSIDFQLMQYIRMLERKIKLNWNPPKSNKNRRVVLLFKIAKDGRILSYKVLKSSNNNFFDNAAINALQLAAPFRPLPNGFNGDSIDVQFTFNHNIYGAP